MWLFLVGRDTYGANSPARVLLGGVIAVKLEKKGNSTKEMINKLDRIDDKDI